MLLESKIARLFKPKHFIFDWDGTLINSNRALASAMNTARESCDKPAFTYEEWKDWVGLSAHQAFPREFGEKWYEAKQIYLNAYEKTHLLKIKKMPGADKLLKSLKLNNITSCVISNKTSSLLHKEISHFNWGEHFFSIMGADDTIKNKPDPYPVMASLSLIQEKPTKGIWFVGDNVVDVECAQASHCTSIFVGNYTEQNHPLGPDLIVNDLNQLKVVFESKFK